MLFGLQGAPATLQRMMDYLVDGCDTFAATYVDNLESVLTSYVTSMFSKYLIFLCGWSQQVLLYNVKCYITVTLVTQPTCTESGLTRK